MLSISVTIFIIAESHSWPLWQKLSKQELQTKIVNYMKKEKNSDVVSIPSCYLIETLESLM